MSLGPVELQDFTGKVMREEAISPVAGEEEDLQ